MLRVVTAVVLAIGLVAIALALALGGNNTCLAAGSSGYNPADQPQPQAMVWAGPDMVGKSSVPCLIFFDNEDAKLTDNMLKKIKFMPDDLNKVCLVKVILTPDDIAILFPKKNAKGAEAEPDKSEKPSPGVTLGKKYEIKGVPACCGCDTYGNCLKTYTPEEISNSPGKLTNATKEIAKMQKENETNIPKDYEAMAKRVKMEIDKKSFGSSTISALLKISKYTGYPKTDDARANLDDMNKIATEIFNSYADDDPKTISNLESFASKYKGLPIATEAAKKAKELKSKPKEPAPAPAKKDDSSK